MRYSLRYATDKIKGLTLEGILSTLFKIFCKMESTVMLKAPFTKDEYSKMFKTSPAMLGSRVKLLKYHFAQKDYIVTAPGMAKAMGYANFNAANLQYGTFARELAESMGWYDRITQMGACAIFVLAKLWTPGGEHKYWEWELHTEVVQSLKEIGW